MENFDSEYPNSEAASLAFNSLVFDINQVPFYNNHGKNAHTEDYHFVSQTLNEKDLHNSYYYINALQVDLEFYYNSQHRK